MDLRSLLNNIKNKITEDVSSIPQKVGNYFTSTSNVGQNIKQGYKTLSSAGLIGFNTSPGLIGVDSSKGLVNGVVQQKISPIPQLNQVNKNITNYVQNRYVQPIADLPKNIQTMSNNKLDWKQRGMGALGTLGGVATLFPDPIQDLAMPVFDYAKGARASYLRGGDWKQNVNAGIQSLTLEKPVGLGTALTTNPTGEMIGNLAELPLMLGMTAKLGKGTNIGYNKKTVDFFKNTVLQDPVARNAIHEFANIMETSSGKKNLGEVGKNVQAIATDIFGEKAANLTNKQLYNLFNILHQQAGDQSLFNIKRINPGFTTQSVREGTNVANGKLYDTPQIKMNRSTGKIYLKVGDNQVINDIPKTVQNDIYNASEGIIPRPERRMAANVYLNRKGLEMGADGNIFKKNAIISGEGGGIGRRSISAFPTETVNRTSVMGGANPPPSQTNSLVAQQPFGDIQNLQNQVKAIIDRTDINNKTKMELVAPLTKKIDKLHGKGYLPDVLPQQPSTQDGLYDTKFYHATSKENAASILENGWNPKMNITKSETKPWIMSTSSDRKFIEKFGNTVLEFKPKSNIKILKDSDPVFNKLFSSSKSYEEVLNKAKDMGYDVVSSGKENSILNPEKFTASNVAQQQPSSITQNNMTPVGDILASKPQIEVPKASINGQTNAQPIIPPKKSATPQDIATQLPNKVENFVNKVLGYSTETPTGGTRQASTYTKILRSGQEAVTRKVEQGMGSENTLVRNAATTLQNFFRGLGMSPERANASMELRGGMSTANERAFNVMDSLYKSIDHNKGSLERINAVLDPELSKIKVSFKDLTPQEKQVYGIIREGLDLVHDTSYANGSISKELYQKNQGKYTPRMYDVMELPPEVNKFVTQGKKLVTDLYKSRKELDQWKVENNLNDPVYALGKRLAQVDTNAAIKKYTDFLASNERFVSDIERPGFTKLSDSPAYGSLSGKYVLNSAVEDLKGFFFANEGMQNLYDVFRAYDRLPIRQLQKKLLTVFNPTTNVGNIVSDQVFGFVTGVDPLTLNKNLIKLKTNPSEFKQLSDYLMRKGITATDITRTDFVNKLGQIDDLAAGKKSNMIKIVSDKVQSFYGGTDDVYKVSAFKSLLDRGFTTEEAARKVADGFQNYANVGKFYDMWSKTPIIGSAFIKFQGDLLRIIKNGVVNNPLGLIGFLGTLYGVAKLSSKLSGETPEDYKTRTERFAAPMIPGLNIPLTWQTPWGEINAARYISPFYANNDTTNIAKMLPFMPNIQPNKDVASNIAMNANDPLLAPFVQLAVNRDFRGKPISDPKENKYQPSTLTPQEKLTNQAVFAGRAYLPPPVNSAIDVGSAVQGKPNMYGTPQTVPQAVARLGGIKISNYGPEEVQKIRDDEAKYQGYANDAIDKQISTVTKGLLQGEVTPEQAMKRIEYLSTKKSEITQGGVTKINDNVVKVGNEYKYLDDNGDQQTILDFALPEAPKLTGNTELDKKLISKYKGKLTAEANDVVKRWELGIIDQGEAEKQLNQIKSIQSKGKKPKKISIKFTKPKKSKVKINYPKLKAYKVSMPNIKKKSNVAFKIKQPKKLKIT